MKNKELVLNRFDKIRNNINSIKYLVNTGGSFEEIREAFDVVYETLEETEGLVSIEHDQFRTNQII